MSDVAELLAELGAGAFEEKLARVIGETAMAVMSNNREGEVVLKFKMKPISNVQAKVVHTIEFKAPTPYGVKSEKNATDTVMYVGSKGKMSIFPENQTQMFTNQGKVNTTKA
jgi:hypothetical protein